jgi:phospholipase D1/2
MREHLGLLPPEDLSKYTDNSQMLPTGNAYDWGSKDDKTVTDPLSPEFWSVLNTTADTNTSIFKTIFHSLPDDSSERCFGC